MRRHKHLAGADLWKKRISKHLEQDSLARTVLAHKTDNCTLSNLDGALEVERDAYLELQIAHKYWHTVQGTFASICHLFSQKSRPSENILLINQTVLQVSRLVQKHRYSA